MEQLLPFIIAAFVFGYQIYSNFKKEQEKAKKRNMQSGQPPKPTQRKATMPRPGLPSIPSIEQKRPVTIPVQSVQTTEVEEVWRAKQVHQAHHHAFKRLEPFRVPEEEAPEVSFDLREAVIQSIILERPYA